MFVRQPIRISCMILYLKHFPIEKWSSFPCYKYRKRRRSTFVYILIAYSTAFIGVVTVVVVVFVVAVRVVFSPFLALYTKYTIVIDSQKLYFISYHILSACLSIHLSIHIYHSLSTYVDEQFVHGTHETSNKYILNPLNRLSYHVRVCMCVRVFRSVVALLTGQSYPSFILFHFFSLKINKTDNLRGIVIVVELLLKWKDFDCFLNSFAWICCSITLRSLLPFRTCIKCNLNLHISCRKHFVVKSIESELRIQTLNLLFACPPTHRFQFQFSKQKQFVHNQITWQCEHKLPHQIQTIFLFNNNSIMRFVSSQK